MIQSWKVRDSDDVIVSWQRIPRVDIVLIVSRACVHARNIAANRAVA